MHVHLHDFGLRHVAELFPFISDTEDGDCAESCWRDEACSYNQYGVQDKRYHGGGESATIRGRLVTTSADGFKRYGSRSTYVTLYVISVTSTLPL